MLTVSRAGPVDPQRRAILRRAATTGVAAGLVWSAPAVVSLKAVAAAGSPSPTTTGGGTTGGGTTGSSTGGGTTTGGSPTGAGTTTGGTTTGGGTGGGTVGGGTTGGAGPTPAPAVLGETITAAGPGPSGVVAGTSATGTQGSSIAGSGTAGSGSLLAFTGLDPRPLLEAAAVSVTTGTGLLLATRRPHDET